MDWNDFDQAMKEAETTMKLGNGVANNMSRMLRGRLRHCDSAYLRALKREIRDFNMATGAWKQLGDDR